MKKLQGPLVLVVLDGWGERAQKEDNAILAAHTPFWDSLKKKYPHTALAGSGQCVGLPEGQMGNSEVGHMHMGAGRTLAQDYTRIDQAIETGAFFNNPTITEAFLKAKQTQKALHLIGLLSPGGVHSHEKHIHALLRLAAKLALPHVYLHLFLDGRDTPPKSALPSLQALNKLCTELHCGQIVSLIGRYYAMDRDQRWDRIQATYDLVMLGKSLFVSETPEAGLLAAYARGETDEFVQATRIQPTHAPAIQVESGDVMLFANFRSDRARELTQAIIDPNFKAFPRPKDIRLAAFVSMTQYDKTFPIPVAYPPQTLPNLFGEYISHLGLTQLRISETEKYAHVTFFFNGGVEEPFPGEERVLIPSPKVATYDLVPEMSAEALTDRLITAIKTAHYDVIICNYPNPDMVGHTGDFAATVKAIEFLDHCLQRLSNALNDVGGELVITADHGNAEQMFDPQSQQAHTAHTCNLVPFIYVGRKAVISHQNGDLSDIAPTLLYLLDIPIPTEMTGTSLVHFRE